ncbi:MAG: hypothetical protein J5565_01930 [Muribaculaceae bacterium]|nr:hypothetical protein [Muribaculaceae bacterium]
MEKLNLTETEMLALWKRVMHIEPVRRECAVERDDGINLDDFLLIHLRQWYAHLLLTAPIEWLPVEDLKTDVPLSSTDTGVATAMLPTRCVRPVEWRLAGWPHSVTRFLAPDDPAALAQRSEWIRSGVNNPAIIAHDDRLTLYGITPGTAPVLLTARCVATPEDGRYILHHDALSALPRWPL